MSIKFKLLRPTALAPTRATDGSAGFDLYWCPESIRVSRQIHDKWRQNAMGWGDGPTIILETGVAMAVPAGFVGLVFSRSGHGFKNNVRLANCVGVIDSDYRGEIRAKMTIDSGSFHFELKDKICQLVVVPIMTEYEMVEQLSSTERGDKGYGSSGR